MKQKLKDFLKNQPLVVKMYRMYAAGGTFKSSLTKSIKGTGNKLNIHSSALFMNCKLTINGNNNEITIADTTMFNDLTIYIFGDDNKITIDRDVKFEEKGSIWVEDHHCEVHLGEGSYYRSVDIAVTEPYSKLTVGKHTGFGFDIDIRTGDSHSIIDNITNKRINYAKDIVIGDDVWVTAHVSILKGAQIASHSVVGMRSLVTKKFTQENVIIAGNPAAIVRENIRWSKYRIYDK